MVSVDLLKAFLAEPETLKHYQFGLNIFLKLKYGWTLLIYLPHNHRHKNGKLHVCLNRNGQVSY